jgi:hypothetical protein
MKANILTCPDSKGKIAGETLLLEKIWKCAILYNIGAVIAQSV